MNAWYDDAHCKGIDINIFFPDNPGGQDSVYRQALKYCTACAVRQECLAFAMDAEKDQRCRFGMFGGKTPKERYVLADQPVPTRIRK